MRISITLAGKATTISVDDVLIDYLGAYLVQQSPKLHSDAEAQLKKAKKYIRNTILKRANVPAQDLSQYVQKIIIHTIAVPELCDILIARGDRFKKEPLDASSLFKSPEELAIAKEEVARMASKPFA